MRLGRARAEQVDGSGCLVIQQEERSIVVYCVGVIDVLMLSPIISASHGLVLLCGLAFNRIFCSFGSDYCACAVQL
jgi:hypothetical protein